MDREDLESLLDDFTPPKEVSKCFWVSMGLLSGILADSANLDGGEKVLALVTKLSSLLSGEERIVFNGLYTTVKNVVTARRQFHDLVHLTIAAR
jgi:hypothetical protein